MFFGIKEKCLILSHTMYCWLLVQIYLCCRNTYQGSLLFVTYTIIQGIIGSEMLVRTGPLNGKCKKEKIKHDNKIKIT